MPPLPPRGMDAITSIRQLVERNVTLPLQNMKLWSQNSTFKIDALGLVTLLGAEEVNRSIDHLQQRRRYTEYLPLLAAFVVAGNHFTTEQPGFVIYNLTDGITSTELKGWFTRWLMSPTVTTKGLNPAVNRLATATTKSAINCKHVLYKPSLPATLGGRDISAFPDIGAPANFITQRYVHDLGLAINFGTRKSVKTSVGTTINIIGTVKLPFSFEGETESHQLEFNVIQKAVHDVIVGSPFLSLTETFTRHIHRVKQVIRKIHLPRVCYLGSHQYVGGEIDGIYVDAVPDTGADVSVMSSSFAEKHGFMIDTGQEHRVLLEFADGSTATSIGMVDIEWKFGSSEIPYHIDAYVLEELQTDFILDNTFLHGTDAFIAYEEDFWMDDSDSFEDGWMISIIKLVGSVLKHSRWRRSSSPPEDTTNPPDEAWRLEKSRQLHTYSLARKHAQGMTEDQKIVFLRPHLAQGKQFLEASQSSLSQVTNSTSLAAGASGPVTSPAIVGRPSLFSKLRRPKRKPSTPAVTPPAHT